MASGISFIVPTLNEQDLLGELLSSLQPYRRRGHEVLLADGGSRDGTVQLARPLVDRVIIAKRGRARQMNAAAALARNEMLVFVHADTRLPPMADQLLLGALKDSPETWGRFDIRLSSPAWSFRMIEWFMNRRSRLSGIATGDQAIFVSRILFDDIGGYPEIDLMEDIALCRALKRKRRPLCLTDRVASSTRKWDENGIWGTIWLMWRLRLAFLFGTDPGKLAARYYARELSGEAVNRR